MNGESLLSLLLDVDGACCCGFSSLSWCFAAGIFPKCVARVPVSLWGSGG